MRRIVLQLLCMMWMGGVMFSPKGAPGTPSPVPSPQPPTVQSLRGQSPTEQSLIGQSLTEQSLTEQSLTEQSLTEQSLTRQSPAPQSSKSLAAEHDNL